MRRFTQEIDAIFARHASIGLLKSGGTIKALVRALDDTTAAAINDGLNGIARVTEHAGRKRKRLVDELKGSLEEHYTTAEGTIRFAIEKIGLGGDFKHAVPLIERAKRRHHERIADFEEGWTAPVGKPWNERHPIYFALIIAIVGAAFGAIATSWISG